jgi:phosphoserine phosphatase SerB
MNETHFLIWISPIISQNELEELYHWVNLHLHDSGLLPLISFSKIKTTLVFEPEEALKLQFQIENPGTPHALERFKEGLWSEIFAGSQPGPLPFALSIQSARLQSTPKRLACFDMDSTLIDQEVIDEIAREAGFFEEVSSITEQAMQGKLDFAQSLRARVGLFRGMEKHQATAIIPSLTVSPGGEKLLGNFRALGMKTAVVSGGFEFILKHFEKSLFLDHVFGNALTTDDEDRLTGEVEAPIVDASYKQTLVRQMKSNYGFTRDETITIGDGANDILMMDEAGLQVSFCGKPKLSAHTNTLILHRNLLWLKSLI